MTDDDQHRLIVGLDGDGTLFTIVCPYDPADTTRPCWPHDIEQEPPVPLPPPQACLYVEWIDNLGGEIVDGSARIDVPFVVEFDGDGAPTFVVRDPEPVPCPHITTGEDGTSYCDLAEREARRVRDLVHEVRPWRAVQNLAYRLPSDDRGVRILVGGGHDTLTMVETGAYLYRLPEDYDQLLADAETPITAPKPTP